MPTVSAFNNNYNSHNLHSHQNHNNHQVPPTKRIYGGVPKTEPSSRVYTATHPSPTTIQMPQSSGATPHILGDQQLGIATSKLPMPHARHYSAMQKHPQSTKKTSQSGRNSEPDRSPDPHTKPKGANY
ncbi:GL21418 [Drosophila persimilis]|uniref:GL21418 n=1 Tax=Drosophila persimilis TaxID=7234 RepID=B4ISB7_DROPE|nr:GL21418 [Drosophila persimilis]